MSDKKKWLPVYLSEDAVQKLLAAKLAVNFHPDDIALPSDMNFMTGEQKEATKAARQALQDNPPSVSLKLRENIQPFCGHLDELVMQYAASSHAGAVQVPLRARFMQILEWLAECEQEPIETTAETLLRQAVQIYKPAWEEAKQGQGSGTMTRERFEEIMKNEG